MNRLSGRRLFTRNQLQQVRLSKRLSSQTGNRQPADVLSRSGLITCNHCLAVFSANPTFTTVTSSFREEQGDIATTRFHSFIRVYTEIVASGGVIVIRERSSSASHCNPGVPVAVLARRRASSQTFVLRVNSESTNCSLSLSQSEIPAYLAE